MSSRSLGGESAGENSGGRRRPSGAPGAWLPGALGFLRGEFNAQVAAIQAAQAAEAASGGNNDLIVLHPDSARLAARQLREREESARRRLAFEEEMREQLARDEALARELSGDNAEPEETQESRREAFKSALLLLLPISVVTVVFLALFADSVADCGPQLVTFQALMVSCCLSLVALRYAGAQTPNTETARLQFQGKFSAILELCTFGALILGNVTIVQSWEACQAQGAGDMLWLSVVLLVFAYGICVAVIAALVLLCIFAAMGVVCCPCLSFLIWYSNQLHWKKASKKAIESLPTETFQKGPADLESGGSGEADLRCAICLEDYEDGNVLRRLPCNHRLHKDCADSWLKLNGTCPECRARVDGKSDS